MIPDETVSTEYLPFLLCVFQGSWEDVPGSCLYGNWFEMIKMSFVYKANTSGEAYILLLIEPYISLSAKKA